MAKLLMSTLKPLICLFLLAITFLCASSSARILNEETPLPADAPNIPDPTVADNPDVVAPVVAPATTLPSGQPSATATVPETGPPLTTTPVVAPVADIPDTGAAPIATPSTTSSGGAASTTTATTGAAATSSGGSTVAAATTGGAAPDHPTLSFFMHDILGGSNPSGRVVTGVVANSDVNNVPFTKANNQIFPINGGVPLNTINGAINNNNYPFLIGLNGNPSNALLNTPRNTLVQNSGNNNIVSGGSNQAFVTAGQLPAGLNLQQLMFGSTTVVDNEITEGHELGSGVLGKAQGFYMTSSSDGSSHTLVLTALFHGGDHHETDDTISFFGVHRTATPISHITVIGGTGKYENARGYATIETLPHEDQHTTDGLETITKFSVYITP